MKLSTYIRKASFAIVFIAGFSCSEDFIDLNPITAASSTTFYSTESDMINAINGTYAVLQSSGLYANEHIFSEISTDNASTLSSVCLVGYCDFDEFKVTPGGTPAADRLNVRWRDAYKGISRANAIINRIDAAQIGDNMRTRITGEAKFLRALFYFNLVRPFGDVPLVLTELEPVESFNVGRESKAAVYAQIIKDLEEAAIALPLTYSGTDVGRATSGAANALLGKVQLTNKEHTQAAIALKKVVDSNVYSLLADYASVFAANNGYNAEIVFSVQYKRGNGEGSAFASLFAPFGSGSTIAVSATGALVPTIDVLNSYEAGDLRLPVSVATYTYANGTTTLYTRKFLDTGAAGNDADNDWPVIRYADVLLMYAEALNETTGAAAAEAPMNIVRARAGLVGKTGLTQEDMRLALEQERRVELAFEGHRWWDLVRTDRAQIVLDTYFASIAPTNTTPITVKPHQLIFPIPQGQIDVNPTKISQNPGY